MSSDYMYILHCIKTNITVRTRVVDFVVILNTNVYHTLLKLFRFMLVHLHSYEVPVTCSTHPHNYMLLSLLTHGLYTLILDCSWLLVSNNWPPPRFFQQGDSVSYPSFGLTGHITHPHHVLETYTNIHYCNLNGKKNICIQIKSNNIWFQIQNNIYLSLLNILFVFSAKIVFFTIHFHFESFKRYVSVFYNISIKIFLILYC